MSAGIGVGISSVFKSRPAGGPGVVLEYAASDYCSDHTPNPISPTLVTPSGGTFSFSIVSGGPTFGFVPANGTVNIQASDPGSYIITYTVGSQSANFPINIGAAIDTTITGDSATCVGVTPSPANLTAVSGYSNYEWFKDNVSVQNGASNTYTPAFNVAGSFVYKVTITDNSLSTACTATSSNFTFTVNALPTISISTPGGAEGFCAGSNIVITASPSSGTFAWYKDGTVISGATGYQYTASAAGEYKATVTDANGCISALSNGIDLEEFASPSVTIATVPGTTICTGDTATLTANVTGGTGTISYLWSTSATSQAISVTTSGTYTVTVTDGNGCTATASQAITVSTAATTIASINNDAAMSFNGTDSYVIGTYSSSLGITGDLTLSAWFKSSASTNQRIISMDSGSSTGRNYIIQLESSGYVRGIVWSGSTAYQAGTISTTPGLSDGNWHHVALVYKPSTKVEIFIDGVSKDQNTSGIPSSINSIAQDLVIGRAAPATGNFFNGSIDEVAIFNTALSSCDIKGIYDATTTVAGQPKSANLLDTNTTISAPVYWNRMGDS